MRGGFIGKLRELEDIGLANCRARPIAANVAFDHGQTVGDTIKRTIYGFKRTMSAGDILPQQINIWRAFCPKARSLLVGADVFNMNQ